MMQYFIHDANFMSIFKIYIFPIIKSFFKLLIKTWEWSLNMKPQIKTPSPIHVPNVKKQKIGIIGIIF